MLLLLDWVSQGNQAGLQGLCQQEYGDGSHPASDTERLNLLRVVSAVVASGRVRRLRRILYHLGHAVEDDGPYQREPGNPQHGLDDALFSEVQQGQRDDDHGEQEHAEAVR